VRNAINQIAARARVCSGTAAASSVVVVVVVVVDVARGVGGW
jgi:hypothetical protein